jgi:ribosomal protein L7/L12
LTILAIKLLRKATGVGLKEAKDVIDEVRNRQRA